MRAHRRRHGFTLIEMVVLIIIMAVLSSIAVPTYSHFKARMEFAASVREVVGLFAYARDAAVQNDTECTVHFDAQSATFVVTVEEPPLISDAPTALVDTQDTAQSAPESQRVVLGEDVAVGNFSVQSVDDPQGTINQTGTVSTVVFRPNGTSDAAQFTMAAVEGFTSRLSLVPTTGLVVVADGDEETP